MPAENDNASCSRCCICLNKDTNTLWKLSSSKNDGDEKTWIYMLRSCVREIEWFEDNVICLVCSEYLDTAYRFRQMCFNAAKTTHKVSDVPDIKTEEPAYDELEQKHNFVNLGSRTQKKSPVSRASNESSFCKYCSIHFDTNMDLEDHTKKIHCSEEQIVADHYDDISNDSTYDPNDSDYCGDEQTDTKDSTENAKIKRAINSLARDFSCEICKIDCKNMTQLLNHSITEHQMRKQDVKTYTCNKCTHKFRLASSLLQHLSYHDGLRDQICTFCGKGFMTRSDLIAHEKIHSSELKYKCPNCDRTFKTHSNLRTHRMLKHTDRSTWPHKCNVCGKRFLMKSGYNAHMRMHNNERPFSCHLCGKSFIENGVLLKHLRTHSNVRAFKCAHCEKEYKDKHNMKIHMVREHNIGNIKVPKYNTTKKFFCDLCPKGFVEKSKLTRHLHSHSGERPFACNICEKRFTDKSYIRPHMKSVHNALPD